MNKLATGIIRFRILILLMAGVITAGLGYVLPGLQADDDLLKFLPSDNPEIALFKRVNERFGGLDVAIVGLEADTLFTENRLKEIRKLTRNLSEIDGVFDVMSFTEAPDPRPSPFGLVVEPLVDAVPSGEQELKTLKKRVLTNDTAVGNLISKDGKAAMILCFLGGARPPIHIAADIKKEALPAWKDGDIYFGGAPFIRLHIAGGTKEDLVKLTPVVALVVLLVTFIIFRRPVGVILALGVVGVALVWLMGLLALDGGGLTVVDTSLPTLLVAVGGAYGIHILSAYFNGKTKDVKSRVKEALSQAGAPVIASTLTTCAGFMSFLAMDVAPLRKFGVFASVGIALTAILALTVIPAVLSFGRKVPDKLAAGFLTAPMGWIGKWSSSHRVSVIGVACLLSAVGLVGAMRIAPDATLKTFFAKGSEPDKAAMFLDRNFGGSVYLQVYFEGDLRSPFVLAELRKIVEFSEGMDEVVQVSSIIDPLVMMSEAMGGRADLPINRDRTRSLYPFLDGTAAIDQIVAPEKDAGLIQIRLKNMAPTKIAQAVDELKAFVKSEVATGIKTTSLHGLPKVELDKINGQRMQEVSKRVIRLVRLHSDFDPEKDSLNRVISSLEKTKWQSNIEPGPDLDESVSKIVKEHIEGEASPFMEPEPGSSLEAIEEWSRRGDLAKGALALIAHKRTEFETVRKALEDALPLTSQRDCDGLTIASRSVVSGLASARATVRANRLAGPVLTAIGMDDPRDELKTKVAWALSDMDSPSFGLRDSSSDSDKVVASVTGQPIVNTAFCKSTIRNQFKSLIVAIIVLTTILSITFRSLRTAMKALMPPLFTLAMAVGVMGALAIPLDLTTSMIAAIALGIGVDYSIHFLWRRRTRGESLEQTASKVGPSIGANAFQVAAGFAVMSISDMIPMQRFGALVAMAMILSATCTFALLPALRAEGKKK